jgi:hypothetical protein
MASTRRSAQEPPCFLEASFGEPIAAAEDFTLELSEPRSQTPQRAVARAGLLELQSFPAPERANAAAAGARLDQDKALVELAAGATAAGLAAAAAEALKTSSKEGFTGEECLGEARDLAEKRAQLLALGARIEGLAEPNASSSSSSSKRR